MALENQKALLQGEIRKDVEEYLGRKEADREYELEARKRLFHAIGPLRVQLLLACRDLTNRVHNYPHKEYKMNIKGYYGRSTLYRILRPLAITELIERQITYTDFSLDASAMELLRYRRSILKALHGEEVVFNHPNVDWTVQEQHILGII